jgi:hypothetical protein
MKQFYHEKVTTLSYFSKKKCNYHYGRWTAAYLLYTFKTFKCQ